MLFRWGPRMLVHTSRFGRFQSSQEEVIIMPAGLIGFESSRHWLIIPDQDNPDVAWLQSLAQSQVALPLVSPRKFAPDYKICVAERDLASLSIRSTDRVFVLNVVSKTGKTLTLNLRSPIVVNLSKRLAAQVISSESLPLAMPISFGPSKSLRMAA